MRENIYNIYHRSIVFKELNKGPKHDRKMGKKITDNLLKKRLKWYSDIWKNIFKLTYNQINANENSEVSFSPVRLEKAL